MEPLYYVMAIMGCADGGELCAEARLAAPRYTSFQSCQAAMDTELMRAMDLSYPEIRVTCHSAGPQMVATPASPRGG